MLSKILVWFNYTFIDVRVCWVEHLVSKTIKTLCFVTKIKSNSYLKFKTNLILKLNCFYQLSLRKNCWKTHTRLQPISNLTLKILKRYKTPKNKMFNKTSTSKCPITKRLNLTQQLGQIVLSTTTILQRILAVDLVSYAF